MPLKIIGAGFGRTGTASLYVALRQLGYPCYHMFEVLQNKANKTHLRFWREVGNAPAGVQHDWEKVFANYTAAVDFPAAAVWRDLLAAYPDAKVILTLHPKGAAGWYESTYETIYAPQRMWQTTVLEYTTPFGRNMADMSRKLIWGRALKDTMDDRDRAIARYNAHIDEVKAAVPQAQLLVFSADQGWAPLCGFLGLPVPEGAFPAVNDRKEIKKMLNGIMNGAYVVLAVGGILAAGLVYATIRLFG